MTTRAKSLRWKYLLFSYYGWLVLLFGLSSMALIYCSEIDSKENVILSVLGALLGFCYFVQKQKLEEMKLFIELFEKFNGKYAELNQDIQNIVDSKKPPDHEGRDTLIDYFNLCAEEYLYFKEGFILPSAWTCWCRGMGVWLSYDNIRSVWNEEAGSDSFYGLTTEIIDRDATGK
jgi:hypothetical protein